MSWRRVRLLGGIHVAIEERLEDSLCAELVDEAHHGMAFGVLAMVNVLSIFSLQCNWGPTLVRRRHNSGLWLQRRAFPAGTVLVARLRPSVNSPSQKT